MYCAIIFYNREFRLNFPFLRKIGKKQISFRPDSPIGKILVDNKKKYRYDTDTELYRLSV